MKLSVIIAGIRPYNWTDIYNSFSGVYSFQDYEFVFVSPYDLPKDLAGKRVKLIKDWGSPVRCNQIGLLHSEGEFIIWGADDGRFLNTHAIDNAFNIRPQHQKGVVSLRFYEGNPPPQVNSAWWRLGFHPLPRQCKYAPNHYLVIMNALINREYFIELGGWDCQFEHLGLANIDFAIRLQNDGAEVVLGDFTQHFILNKGARGDHGPIKDAHQKNDKPLFGAIYNSKANRKRSIIDINNWKKSAVKWRRFK